ncbi:MAG TPA: CaiB/BaiF CoA-transferase family protein [Bacillota bacterium]|nr:CaiB/BaiF CoA-transferase family protein [Bacillota bacterium]
MTRPLEGVRILDFSQFHGAAYATMQLADFGAEVIKIEKPGRGDISRACMPLKDGYSGYHAYLNRGKKSVAVDYSKEEGREVIRELVRTADVVCENFRYGTLEKYWLGYDRLKEINPRLIYATLTGYGRSGELKDRACFDNTAQAFSSMLEMSGEEGGPPVTMGAQLGNLYGGLHLALAINIALIHRHKTGEGQAVDISCIDSLFSALEESMVTTSLTGEVLSREGNGSKAICPYDTYNTLDGAVSIAVSTEAQWEKFCKAMGLEHIMDDPRYNSNDSRNANYRSSLRGMIQNIVGKMSKFEIEELLSEFNIPCGAVCTIIEAIDSKQTQERDMIIEVEDKVIGRMKQLGIPAKLHSTPGSVENSAPLLGEDTVAYLKDLGYSAEKIAGLIDNRILEAAEGGMAR